MKSAAAGLAAAVAPGALRAGEGEIGVRLTAGSKRYAREAPLQWMTAGTSAADVVEVDPTRAFQEVLGFGAAFTDSACYLFSRLPEEARARLFREMFHPSELGFSVGRLAIGASDYAAKLYSFDEGEPDPELRRFSIDHDRQYILPILRQARGVNPDLFLLGSPWSPPGWMKPNGSMLGGCMRQSSFDAYARYFVRFLQDFAAAGVKVNAVSVQNEVDTEQDGRMPACAWPQEYEMAFVADHLGPQFERSGLEATKIWILDHNYSLWGRAICELDAPEVSKYVDGVAWHGYVGAATGMTRVHEAHPSKHAYWTEGGPDVDDPTYRTEWAKWSATFTGILRNWARCIIGWNLALDEDGKPNIGPFRCGGPVTIHSKTGEIVRSGMYWALAHYSAAVRRGARRVDSSSRLDGLAHVAFAAPDGGGAAVLTNPGGDRKVILRVAGRETEVAMPADSVMTLTWA